MSLEYWQAQGINHITKKPVAVFDHLHGKEMFPKALSSLAGYAVSNVSQNGVYPLGCQGTLLAHTEPVATRNPTSLSAELLSGHLSPSLYRCPAFSFAELHALLIAQCSNLSRSRCKASRPSRESAAPPSLVPSANWLRMHSTPASRTWKCWTQLELSPGEHCWWLAASQTLPHSLQPFELYHRTSSSPRAAWTYLSHGWTIRPKDAVRDSIKGLTEIQKDYVHCLSFIHKAGDLIIEGDQITKVGLPLMNPYQLREIIALFFKCFSLSPRSIVSATFPWTDDRLIGLQLPGSSLVPFL